jgi:hypothetical protein
MTTPATALAGPIVKGGHMSDLTRAEMLRKTLQLMPNAEWAWQFAHLNTREFGRDESLGPTRRDRDTLRTILSDNADWAATIGARAGGNLKESTAAILRLSRAATNAESAILDKAIFESASSFCDLLWVYLIGNADRAIVELPQERNAAKALPTNSVVEQRAYVQPAWLKANSMYIEAMDAGKNIDSEGAAHKWLQEHAEEKPPPLERV